MLHRYPKYIFAIATLLAFGTANGQQAKPRLTASLAQPSPVLRTNHPHAAQLKGGGGGGDDCANAQVLTVGTSCVTIAGSTIGATQSLPAILCNGFTAGSSLDVWFTFTATATTTTITATGLGDFDVVMEVFSGTCGNLTSLGCADATFPPNSLVETFVANTVAGQTYYARIYCYTPPANVSTDFTICAFSQGGGNAPPNDDCTGATAANLSVGSTITLSGDNTNATVDAPTTFTIVWEAFTITDCANIDIGYCAAGSVFDDFLVNLSVGCPDFLTGLLTGTVSVDNCTLSFLQLPAGTYYIPVMVDAALTPVGAYSITVTASACGGNPPANDLCDSATPIGVNATCVGTAGTTENATQSLAPAACSGFTAASASDVWFSFTAVGTSTTVEVTGAGDATTGMDPVLEAFSGTCAALTSLGCMDATLRGGTETLVLTTTPGTTYLYRIYHWPYVPQTVFGFTTCVYGAGGGNTPPNDDCNGAVVIPLPVPGSIQLSGDNTGATVDPPTTLVLVWEAFSITACADVVVNTCVPGFEFDLNYVNLAVNCPDFLTAILTGGLSNDSCTVSFFSLPPGTYYVPVRVDPALAPVGPYTIEVSAVPCTTAGPYCDAGAVATTDEKITNVTFVDINNNSTSAAGYENFSAISTDVVAGVAYPITVTFAPTFATDQVLVWIDWDHSLAFEAGELMYTSPIGVGPFTGNVAVPLTAVSGPTRMRVRLHDTNTAGPYQNTPNPTPCDTSTYGQVEDYTVDMIGIITGVQDYSAATWSVFPNPGNGDISIRYAGESTKVTVEVMDMTGRIVHSELRQFTTGTTEQFGLAEKLATGTYLLRFTTDKGRDEQRIVIR